MNLHSVITQLQVAHKRCSQAFQLQFLVVTVTQCMKDEQNKTRMITPLLTCLTSIYLCCLMYLQWFLKGASNSICWGYQVPPLSGDNPVGGLPQEMSLYLTVCFFNCKRFICCKKDQAVETYHCLNYVVLVFYQQMEQLSIAASIHSTPSTNYLPVLVLEKTVSGKFRQVSSDSTNVFFFLRPGRPRRKT